MLPKIPIAHSSVISVVNVFVETPTNLNSRQKALLEEFATMESPANLPQKKGFIDKIKDLFA